MHIETNHKVPYLIDMGKTEEIKNVQQHVMQLLIKYAHLRDDQHKLTANIWAIELTRSGYTPHMISGFDFLKLYSEGKISSEETIARARRKVQEEHPHLRGIKYEERKAEEERTRKTINNG